VRKARETRPMGTKPSSRGTPPLSNPLTAAFLTRLVNKLQSADRSYFDVIRVHHRAQRLHPRAVRRVRRGPQADGDNVGAGAGLAAPLDRRSAPTIGIRAHGGHAPIPRPGPRRRSGSSRGRSAPPDARSARTTPAPSIARWSRSIARAFDRRVLFGRSLVSPRLTKRRIDQTFLERSHSWHSRSPITRSLIGHWPQNTNSHHFVAKSLDTGSRSRGTSIANRATRLVRS